MLDVESNHIKFYIIIPVYKAENSIKECIESILNQTYGMYTIILVNDGSPDCSGEICDGFAQRNNQIHVLHKVNEGQLSARQRGIDYVRRNFHTEKAFFIFVDSDDTLEPYALDKIAQTVIRHDCDMVIYGMQRVSNGKVISKNDATSFQGVITDKRELYRKVFLSFEYNSLCRKAIRCDLLPIRDYTDFYHVRRGEDLVQSVCAYEKCQKAVFVNDVLYNYTVNPTSITQSITYETYFVDSSARALVWNFLESENVFTNQDKIDFFEHCCCFLRKELLMVGAFDVVPEKITALFEQIKADKYFSMIINCAKKDCLLSWLRKDQYSKIIFCAKVRNRLARLYRGAKNSLANALFTQRLTVLQTILKKDG